MEQEHNSQTLQRAIQALPSYQPSEDLWDTIEEELEQGAERSKGWPLDHLPVHQPSPSIWENIARELDQPADKDRPLPLRRMNWRKLSRIAAISLFLITAWLMFIMKSGPKVSYGEASIQASNTLAYKPTAAEDEPMILMVRQAFEKSPLAQQQNTYNSLLSELKELDQAKNDILDMMEYYGQDEQMIRELAEIERARTDIVMKMARFI